MQQNEYFFKSQESLATVIDNDDDEDEAATNQVQGAAALPTPTSEGGEVTESQKKPKQQQQPIPENKQQDEQQQQQPPRQIGRRQMRGPRGPLLKSKSLGDSVIIGGAKSLELVPAAIKSKLKADSSNSGGGKHTSFVNKLAAFVHIKTSDNDKKSEGQRSPKVTKQEKAVVEVKKNPHAPVTNIPQNQQLDPSQVSFSSDDLKSALSPVKQVKEKNKKLDEVPKSDDTHVLDTKDQEESVKELQPPLQPVPVTESKQSEQKKEQSGEKKDETDIAIATKEPAETKEETAPPAAAEAIIAPKAEPDPDDLQDEEEDQKVSIGVETASKMTTNV